MSGVCRGLTSFTNFPPYYFTELFLTLSKQQFLDNEQEMSRGVSKLDTIAFVRERLYSPSKIALMLYAPKVNLFMPSKADEEPHLYNSPMKT